MPLVIQADEHFAQFLIDENAAQPRPKSRGNLPQLLLDGVAVATTVISLSQGPDTFFRLADLIRTYLGHVGNSGGRLTVRGPKGSIVINDISDPGSRAAVAKLLEAGILG